MATANFWKLGCRAPLSAVMTMAISAAFLLLTACGAPEDSNPITPDASNDAAPDTGFDTGPDAAPDVNPDATPDTGFDTGPDAAPDVSPDATPDVETEFTYSELCAECESRGQECPDQDQILNYRPKTAVESAANDLCVDPTPGPCDEYRDNIPGSWDCDGLTINLEVSERTLINENGDEEEICGVSFEGDNDYLPFTVEGDELVITDEAGNQLWTCNPA